MALISQPGSDYQIVSISLDAGYTRDLILMLIDVHAVLDHLYLDGTQPQITSPAEDYLRESASPYSLPALIDALGEVTGQLSRAERQALDASRPARPHANQPAAIPPLASNPRSPPHHTGDSDVAPQDCNVTFTLCEPEPVGVDKAREVHLDRSWVGPDAAPGEPRTGPPYSTPASWPRTARPGLGWVCGCRADRHSRVFRHRPGKITEWSRPPELGASPAASTRLRTAARGPVPGRNEGGPLRQQGAAS